MSLFETYDDLLFESTKFLKRIDSEYLAIINYSNRMLYIEKNRGDIDVLYKELCSVFQTEMDIYRTRSKEFLKIYTKSNDMIGDLLEFGDTQYELLMLGVKVSKLVDIIDSFSSYLNIKPSLVQEFRYEHTAITLSIS